ncbi:MAG: ABC transporter substrate-binding protein [Vulcanococcus sp.]
MPVSNFPGYEYFYLAEQKGLARPFGLDLRTVEFADPQAIVHAYLRGDLAMAQLTTVEAVDICSRAPERCPVVVLVLDESLGGDQVMARPGIGSVAQLRGQRVGVTLSTLGPYVLSRALEKSGLSFKDVQLRNMTLDAMPSALASGAIDAAALFPPYSEQAAQQAQARSLFDSRSIPGEVFDVLVVDPRLLEEQQPALPGLLRAWEEAHALRRKQPQQALPLMARREGVTPAAFAEAEQGLRYFNLRDQRAILQPGGPMEATLRQVRAVQESLNLVKPGTPLPKVSDAAVAEALR